jgi:DHA1 family tetracycline resistance protein-like MFS transporter
MVPSIPSVKPAITLIFIVVVIDTLGLGIIYPILPALIQSLTGQGLSEAAMMGGWLTAVYALMQFFFSPMAGSLSDQFGRRPILIISMAGLFADYILLAVAQNMELLFLGRVLSGIFGASYTAASAYITDIAEENSRAKYFGLLYSGYGLGLVAGPVLGGLFGAIGIRIPFIAAGILSLLCALFVYFVLPESLDKNHRQPFNKKTANPLTAFSLIKKYGTLYRLLAGFFILYVASYVVVSIWPFFTALKFHWTEFQIGISLSIFGLLITVVQAVATDYFTKRIGDWKTVRLGILFYLAGMVIFAFTDHVLVLYLAMIPYCLGGIVLPAIQSIFSASVEKSEQGEIQGILTSAASASAIVGPPLLTSTFAYFTGESAPFYFAGAAFLLAAILFIISLFLISTTKTGQG